MNQGFVQDFGVAITETARVGLFSSLCTIQTPSQALDAVGQVDLTNFTPVAGMINIACMAAVLIDARPNPAYKTKTQEMISEQGVFHVLLSGYFPNILQKYQAVVDGVAYEVMNVESDSQHTQTRLACRRWRL